MKHTDVHGHKRTKHEKKFDMIVSIVFASFILLVAIISLSVNSQKPKSVMIISDSIAVGSWPEYLEDMLMPTYNKQVESLFLTDCPMYRMARKSQHLMSRIGEFEKIIIIGGVYELLLNRQITETDLKAYTKLISLYGKHRVVFTTIPVVNEKDSDLIRIMNSSLIMFFEERNYDYIDINTDKLEWRKHIIVNDNTMYLSETGQRLLADIMITELSLRLNNFKGEQ